MSHWDTLVRFTMPHLVADAVDLDAVEHQARLDGLPALAYRRRTMAGIELACPRGFAPLLLGALRDVADHSLHGPTRDASGATLEKVQFLIREAAGGAAFG